MDQLPFAEQPEDTLGIVKMDTDDHSSFEHFPEVWESNLGLLRGQKHCDVTFLIGPEKKEMKCHKLLLSSRSPVMDAMFSERWDSSETIALENVEPDIFQLFLEFVYGNKFTESIPQAIKLLQVGHKYEVKPLVQKCEKLMTEGVKLEDAIQTFRVARSYSLKTLMERAGDLMTSEFLQLSTEASFRDLDEETLIYLVKSDDLPVVECELFTTVLRWASDRMAENPSRQTSYAEALKNVIPHLRFPLMTAQEFVTTVFPTQILPQKDVIDLFLYFNSNESVRDGVAQRLQYSTVPRKVRVVVDFYTAADSQTALNYSPSYETMKYCSGQESKLEFVFRSPKTMAKGNRRVKLCSVMLQGLNYDQLSRYWPSGRAPSADNKVSVILETLKRRAAEKIFSGECVLPKGSQLELKIQPTVSLQNGTKYRIRVHFQGETLVISTTGQRGHANPNFDMLTSLDLRTTISDPTPSGLVEFEGLKMILPPSEGGYYYDKWKYYTGPLALHVVTGLKLIA